MPIVIRRLTAAKDEATYATVHRWMRAQPDLYEHLTGFDDYQQFLNPGFDVLDFAVEEDGKLIAFAAWIRMGEKRCKFCLVTPPSRINLRTLLTALKQMEDLFFLQLEYEYFYIALRPQSRYDRARNLAKRMGWQRLNNDVWHKNLDIYLSQRLQETYVKKSELRHNPATI